MAGSFLMRKKIRDNVKALLLGNTDAGDNVFTSRANKSFLEELPGIFIYTATDIPSQSRKYEQLFDRKLELVIEIIVAQKDSSQVIQDEADTIAGQVEDLLLPNVFLKNPPPWEASPGDDLVSYIGLGETNLAKSDELQEDLFGVIIEFDVTYAYEKENLATLNDFKRFEAKYKLGVETPTRLVEIPGP